MMANDSRRSQRVKEDENNKSKKKGVTPDASPASSSRRSSRETSLSHKVKDDDNIKSKKKTLTPDASPASSSRRSSRETSSGNRTKESPIKENVINTRRSVRLEKQNPSGTTPAKGKEKKTHEQIITPTKQYDKDRRKKVDMDSSAANLRSRSPVSPARSTKSKKKQVVSGGRKRKRLSTCMNKALSEPPTVRTEEGDEKDKESEETLSESKSSSSSCREVEKTHSLKNVENIDSSDDDCGDRNGEESNVEASKRQNSTSVQQEILTARFIDIEQDRTPCEAAAVAKILEKNNVVSSTDTSICIACNKLRCDHLPLITESIWDTREVEVSETQGLQKQKQYFVKYKGLAHIHNQWITETQLLLDAPLLAKSYSQNGSVKWSEEWTMPHQLLKKRLLLSLDTVFESQENTKKVLNYHHEWLVQWQGLDHEQATWESENISVLNSPEGHNLIKDYEKHHGDANKYDSSDNDRIEEITVNLPTIFAGCPPGMDNIHLSYVKNLHDSWSKGHISIVFDDQERTTRIVLFILSLKSVSLPLLLITRSDSLSQWESMFSKIAPFNAFTISIEETHEKTSFKLLHVRKDGQLAFQLLLYPVDAFVKDLNVLKSIKWEAVIVDESQSSDISSHFSHIKSLSTYKRLLVFCGPLGVSNLDVMPLLDCGIITKAELGDISKLKETLSKLIAYECKSNSSKFVEYWVPVQISNVQLEQYCSMLLSNAMALSACSKSDATGALQDILISNRKCCDHPYIVDQSLQAALTKDLELGKFLDVGIKASGKLQFLDVILPEMRKRQLRVLIVFHPLSGSGKDSTSIGDILDDFVRQRFGENSYERVDGIGMIPSKKQAALSNFNNKEMGRFIFLLEHRACLPSIKLSSVDTIIIFGSDLNPANDLRALQRIAIDSHSEQIMTFRLYTSLTLEEKILRLAENNVAIDSKLQNLSRSTSDKLLTWGATYLFKKLDEFHSDLNMSSEECWWNELMEEFVDLIDYKCKNKDAEKLKITRVKPICGKNITVPNEIDGEPPHTFWRKLLMGKDPCWKYLSRSTQRQRKRPQYFEESPKKTNANNDDVGRKRKKITNNIVEPVASKQIIEGGATNNIIDPVASKTVIKEGEITNNVIDSVASKPVIKEGEITNNVIDPVASKPVTEEGKMSFKDLLKLKISKLCEVLKLSEDVKNMVERFLEYVIENYRVNKEPESTLHAFLISLCWIGSGLLKHKLDRKQSISLANEHLGFSCKENEANSVYLKLEFAKEMFLIHTDIQKKTVVSTDSIPEVKIVLSDSPSNHNQNDNNDCDAADGGGDCNQKDSNVLEDENPVQPLVSPASAQSVPEDLVCTLNSEALPPQPDEEPCLPSGEQQPDTQNSQVLGSSAQVPNIDDTTSGLNNGCQSGNCNLGAPQKKPYDPLQAELERLCDWKNTVVKINDAIKLKIKAEHEKELAKTIAQINAKYEAKNQDADAVFQSKKKEVETYFNRVVMNKILAEAFKSKCQDLSSISPPETQGIQNLPPSQGLARANGVTFSSSPAQSSRSQQVTESSRSQQLRELQPPLQIVNQSSQLFSTPPTRPPSNNTNPYTRPSPPNTNPTTRPPSAIVPSSTPSKPPFIPGIPCRPPPGINSVIPSSSRPINPITATSRPPPNIIPTAPARNLRVTDIRAPPPHLRSFRPSNDHRVMPSQRPSSTSPLSQTSARPLPSQTPPPILTNHNSNPTQNSPRSSPLPSSPPVAPPASSQMPSSYSWHPPGTRPATSSSHTQISLPPMPSVSISHTGLYNPPPSDSRVDIDKQGGSHPPNTSPSPPEVSDLGKEGSVVCLSDDDDHHD